MTTYTTLREREALRLEYLELTRLIVRYSSIGGLLVWVLYNL